SQLASFFTARGGPRGAVLGLAGDFDERAALDQVSRVFGEWKSGGKAPAPLPRATPLERASIVTRPIEGKTQGDVAWGFTPQIERLGPDLQAVMVMNSTLGDFGMGGRIGRSVREEAGLAYHASSYVWAGLTAGPIVVRAGVAPEGL